MKVRPARCAVDPIIEQLAAKLALPRGLTSLGAGRARRRGRRHTLAAKLALPRGLSSLALDAHVDAIIEHALLDHANLAPPR